MRSTPYYSNRTDPIPSFSKLDLNYLKRLFMDLYKSFDAKEYFQEAFGYYCTDSGSQVGTVGYDIEAVLFLKLGKDKVWPIHKYIDSYSESDLFNIIEFCFDCASKPIEEKGYYHAWNQCGWHYSEFEKLTGQKEFRDEINKLLPKYINPCELSADGNILKLPQTGLEPLMAAIIPVTSPNDIQSKLERATFKFRHHSSSINDIRDALKELADILEFLRPQAKELLDSEDENNLFNIANNFSIRHYNTRQKNNYDKPTWYNWIFYYYLATIHTLLGLIEDRKHNTQDRNIPIFEEDPDIPF